MSQQQGDGLCLRYPDNLGIHPSLPNEKAASMLLRAIQFAQTTPFQWSYIDRPSDGQLFLIFVPPQLSFPTDGIRYLEAEQRMVVPISNGAELEIAEVKFGFVPGQDASAYRVRRRYRLIKGGHPQLLLIHYTQGPSCGIRDSLNTPVRNYPLRPIHDPAVYVLGPKAGQKAPLEAGAMAGQHPVDRQPSMPPGGMGQMGMNFPGPMGFAGNPQAMLAHQKNNMEALAQRSQRERERSGSMNNRMASRPDDDDSADEADMISTRTLALTRYRRNHEYMNEVFMYAGFGNLKEAPPSKPAYAVFKKKDLDAKSLKLQAEIEELTAKATARAEARRMEDFADVSMEGLSVEDVV